MVGPKNTSSPSVPKSGAISKGYNFASTWEQVCLNFAPLYWSYLLHWIQIRVIVSD